MKKVIMLLLITSAFFLPNEAKAEEPDLIMQTYVINRILVASDWFNEFDGQVMTGIMIGVADCVNLSGWAGCHLWIPDSDPMYREQLALLLTAKSLGKAVTFWYFIGSLHHPQDNTMGKVHMLALN